MPGTKFLSPKNEVHVELALTAIASMPTLQAASEHLKQQNGLTASSEKLRAFREMYPQRFERIYAQATPIREAYLADGMLENAGLATKWESNAIEQVGTMLSEGKVSEPWRVARDLADVKAKNVDKSRLLQEKPTVIVAKSDHNRTLAYIESRLAELDSGPLEDAQVVPA